MQARHTRSQLAPRPSQSAQAEPPSQTCLIQPLGASDDHLRSAYGVPPASPASPPRAVARMGRSSGKSALPSRPSHIPAMPRCFQVGQVPELVAASAIHRAPAALERLLYRSSNTGNSPWSLAFAVRWSPPPTGAPRPPSPSAHGHPSVARLHLAFRVPLVLAPLYRPTALRVPILPASRPRRVYFACQCSSPARS